MASPAVKLPTDDAVKRMRTIAPAVLEDMLLSVHTRETLEAGNATVGGFRQIFGHCAFLGATTYNSVANSLAMQFCLVLSRLCDTGNLGWHNDKKDICSIPLLMHFLRDESCQAELAQYRHHWFADQPEMAGRHPAECRKAIAQALEAFSIWEGSDPVKESLHTLKGLRDKFLAHALMQREIAVPTFDHAFQLHDAIIRVAEPALFAVTGTRHNFSAVRDHYRSDARVFWKRLIQPSSSA